MNPANWRVSRSVDEVGAIRRALAIGRWHVVGQSWGGTVALEYGARRPAGLASLVLASPLVSTRSWLADAAALRAELPTAVQARLAACDTAPAAAGCDDATAAFYASFSMREPVLDGRRAHLAALTGGRPHNDRLYAAMWGTQRVRRDRHAAPL